MATIKWSAPLLIVLFLAGPLCAQDDPDVCGCEPGDWSLCISGENVYFIDHSAECSTLTTALLSGSFGLPPGEAFVIVPVPNPYFLPPTKEDRYYMMQYFTIDFFDR